MESLFPSEKRRGKLAMPFSWYHLSPHVGDLNRLVHQCVGHRRAEASDVDCANGQSACALKAPTFEIAVGGGAEIGHDTLRLRDIRARGGEFHVESSARVVKIVEARRDRQSRDGRRERFSRPC